MLHWHSESIKSGSRPRRPASCKSFKMLNFQVVSYTFSSLKKIAVACCFWIKACRTKDTLYNITKPVLPKNSNIPPVSDQVPHRTHPPLTSRPVESRRPWPRYLHFPLVRSHIERDKEVKPWGWLWDNISIILLVASNSQFDTDAHSIQHCKLCKSNEVYKKNEESMQDESAVIWIFSEEAWRWGRSWWRCSGWHNQQASKDCSSEWVSE